VTVVNALGLHARAAARFVKIAGRYRQSGQGRARRAHRRRQEHPGLLLLAAARGSQLAISADGTDEADALTCVVRPGRRGVRRSMTRVVGRGVSPGIAVGRAVVAVRDARQVRYRLASSGVDRERQRLRHARERTRRELEEISARVARTIGSAQAAYLRGAAADSGRSPAHAQGR
jgi:phosphocarrier protein